MSYYKTKRRFGQGVRNFEALKPILNVALSFALAIGFLFISAYLILGKFGTSQTEGNMKPNSSIKNNNNFNINEGGVINKEFNLTVDKVKVYLKKEGRVVELPLEEYVKGVISSEMPVSFELEALKAQAIAARTYTIAHTKALGGGCAEAKGADLCDTIHCQVYMSKVERMRAWGVGGEKNWEKIEQAVNDTKGMVLTYNNELAKGAYYFSTSSGKTENVEEVFVSALPYLRSVESPGEQVSPSYQSTVAVPFSKFATTINNEYKDAKVDAKKLKNQVKIKSRTEGGSVKEIVLGNLTIPGKTFRTLFNLKSANFTLEYLTNEVLIKCTGNGHGVGMSQWGANVMAKSGKKYNEILSHYYTGIVIKKVNE